MRASGVIALALVAFVGGASGAPAKEGGVVKVEHRDPLTLPSRGPANALVTIELWYSPYQSSRAAAVRAIERLQAQHPSRIRILYRIVKSGSSQARLPYAAIYAFSEGKFFEFIDAVSNLSKPPDDKALAEIARNIGIDPDRMSAIISKPPAAYDDLLDANEQRRQQHFRGSPPPPNALFNGRLTQTHTAALGASDVEREYQNAKDIAEDMLDRGISQTALSAAFETIPPPVPDEIIVQPGAIDDGSEDIPADPPLANPPLDTKGWPSYGSVNADTTVIVLCSPTSNNCRQPMTNARNVWGKYPKNVRLVWAPYFKVDAEEAADLALLADAALCAEKVGTTFDRNDVPFDDDASSGWRWVETMVTEANSRRRDLDPEKLIDKVAGKLHVDKRTFAACRAQVAGTSVSWIEAARHAGVKTTPATIVGGRIYGPVTDLATLQLLVEAELAPGWLAPTWMHPDAQ